jgi:hypothetical protein
MSFYETFDKHMNSIMQKNMEEFESTIHPVSITLILGNGRMIQDRKEFIRFHEEWFADDDWSIDFKVVKSIVSSDLASVLLKIHYEDLDENANSYHFDYYLQLLFEKVDGNWLLVLDQNTNIS